MKTNNLTHYISKNDKNANIGVKIQLADECKNGHQDFSITANVFEIGKQRTERNLISCGCCHEEILKHFPELEIFVKLHLSDYKGIPMYAVENGYYHLFKMDSNEFCDYYRIKPQQYEEIKNAKLGLIQNPQERYKELLIILGVIKQWEEQANKAIKILEEMTGNEFLIDSTRTNLK